MTSIFHDFDVFIQRPLLRFVLWGDPFLPATFELVRWYLQVDCIFNGIHRDGVSISDECNRAAYLRFRNNVANYEPMGTLRQKSAKSAIKNTAESCSPSTKPSVGHTGYVLAKTCTHNQTGGFEHLWHAWFHDLSIQLLSRIKDPPNDAPGPPFGPRYLRTMTVFSPFLIDPPSTACTNSSSESNTRAFPVKPKPSFPVIFAIAPPGARLPVSTLMRTVFHHRVIECRSSGTDLM